MFFRESHSYRGELHFARRKAGSDHILLLSLVNVCVTFLLPPDIKELKRGIRVRGCLYEVKHLT